MNRRSFFAGIAALFLPFKPGPRFPRKWVADGPEDLVWNPRGPVYGARDNRHGPIQLRGHGPMRISYAAHPDGAVVVSVGDQILVRGKLVKGTEAGK